MQGNNNYNKEVKPNIYYGGELAGDGLVDSTLPSRGHDGSTLLPHLMNTQAGANMWDPMHRSIFQVYFTLPQAIRAEMGAEAMESILTQSVTDVAGLDALQKTPQAGSQKYLGVDVSFMNPTLDNTYADLTINFNLNIRNRNDAYILRVFKNWERLNYDLADGTRLLKAYYTSQNMRVAEANRDGSIFRAYRFFNIMLTGVTGLDTLNYTDNEPAKLACTFRADYWNEDMGIGVAES